MQNRRPGCGALAPTAVPGRLGQTSPDHRRLGLRRRRRQPGRADLCTAAYDTVADASRTARPRLRPGRTRRNARHLPQLIAARIPFVLEKPGAAAVTDLAAVGDEADAAGVPATVALVQRYGPLPDLFVPSGMRHARFSFVAGPPSRYTDAGGSWVLDRSLSGGGCLYLLGVHFTDMLRHLTRQQITRSPVGAPVPRGRRHRGLRRTNAGNRRWNDRHGRDRLDLPGRPGQAIRQLHRRRRRRAPRRRQPRWSGTHAPGQNPAQQTVDVDSDALYPLFVEAVATTYATGSLACRPSPT